MGLIRHALLAASRNAWLRDRATRAGFVRRAVARFMPGETLDAALGAAREQEARGIATVLTLLGENVADPAAADEVRDHYLEVLERVDHLGLPAQISVKPTQLGLDLGTEACHARLAALVERAAALGNMVWIDMEGSTYTEATLELYRRLRAIRPDVGICLQAYLRRTAGDLESLLPLDPAIRLVKGAYMEPPEIAFPSRGEVDRAFAGLAGRLLDAVESGGGVRAAFATHDRRLIDAIDAEATGRGVARDACEWQMLYGIRREEQRRLAREGYRVRVLISYGEAWYPWYMRRLAERPANVVFVAKNLFAR